MRISKSIVRQKILSFPKSAQIKFKGRKKIIKNVVHLNQRVLINIITTNIKEHAIILVLMIIIIMGSCLSPLFLKPSNLTNIGFQASALGILSLAQTIVLLIAGIDLSIDARVTAICVLAAGIMQGEPIRLMPTILLIIGIGTVLGAFNGIIITKFNIPDFITTLGMRSVITGLFMLYCGTREIGMASPYLMKIGSTSVGPIPIVFIIWMIMAILMSVFLKSTNIGRSIYATGGNVKGAIGIGIDVNRIKIIAYSLCGFLSSIAGLILLSRMGVGTPQAGTGFLLDSVAASVIGGTSLFGGRGTILGTVIGALILSIINNLFNLLQISPFFKLIFKGIVVILSVAIWVNIRSGRTKSV